MRVRVRVRVRVRMRVTVKSESENESESEKQPGLKFCSVFGSGLITLRLLRVGTLFTAFSKKKNANATKVTSIF